MAVEQWSEHRRISYPGFATCTLTKNPSAASKWVS
jgi:hypothetical protein